MRSTLIVLILSFMFTTSSVAQNLFEDDEGESTLNFNDKYQYLRLNTSDASIKLGTSFQSPEPFNKRLFGKSDFGRFINVNVKFTAEDGITTLYEDGKSAFAFDLNARPGVVRQWVGKRGQSKLLQLFLDLGIGRANYKLGDSLKKEGFRKQIFASQNYNANINLTSAEKWFLAASIGYRSENNYDELDKGSVTQQYYTSGKMSIAKITDVKIGEYIEKDAFRLRFDVAFLPNWFSNMVGFTAYERSSFFSGSAITDFGGGIFLLPDPDNDPGFNSIGGLGFTLKDTFNGQREDSKAFDRGVLYLFAGFKF